MKKSMTAGLLCLCLAGCGTAPYYENISYDILDYSSESARAEEISEFTDHFNMTGGRVVYKGDIENGEWIEPPDTEKFLAGMDDVTDDIFSSKADDITVYRDKKYKGYMLVRGGKIGEDEYYNCLADVYANTDEYRRFIENIEKRTGFIYSGTRLGKDYTKPLLIDKNNDNFAYTGKNAITFANAESMIDSMTLDCVYRSVYKNAPMQAVLFMDRDEIKSVYIFWQSGEYAPDLSKKNLEQLNIDDTYGGAAQELVSRFFGVNNETEGTYNGIKYKLRQIKCSNDYYKHDGKLLILEK